MKGSGETEMPEFMQRPGCVHTAEQGRRPEAAALRLRRDSRALPWLPSTSPFSTADCPAPSRRRKCPSCRIRVAWTGHKLPPFGLLFDYGNGYLKTSNLEEF